jgi:CHAT domain-containing protein
VGGEAFGDARNVSVVELPKLTDESLRAHMWSPSSEEEIRIRAHLREGRTTSEDVDVSRGGYLSMYRLWQLTCQHPLVSRRMKDEVFEAWKQTLEAGTGWLWDAIMGPVVARLSEWNVAEAVLVPTGLLGLLPLHAAWREDQTMPSRRRYVLDEFCIRYTPSARALRAARGLAGDTTADSMLQVVEPWPTTAEPLYFAEREAQAIREAWRGAYASCWRAEATVERVQGQMLDHNVLHFTGHGFANLDKPLGSGLLLAHDQVLSVADWQTRHTKMRLAVLSACETGVPGMELPDEAVGLPAALAEAGCAGVVASLWSVADESTALLMAHFYQAWQGEGLQPHQALRRAQMCLRDGNGYAHPFDWAAFTYTGV